MAFLHRTAISIAERDMLEIGMGMYGRCGGEADLDAVEVVKRRAPAPHFGCGVPSMALIGDDDIKGVDRDVQLTCIRFFYRPATILRKAQQVDAHALNGADIDIGMRQIGIGQIRGWKQRRIERAFLDILWPESLAVGLVDLIEF